MHHAVRSAATCSRQLLCDACGLRQRRSEAERRYVRQGRSRRREPARAGRILEAGLRQLEPRPGTRARRGAISDLVYGIVDLPGGAREG